MNENLIIFHFWKYSKLISLRLTPNVIPILEQSCLDKPKSEQIII